MHKKNDERQKLKTERKEIKKGRINERNKSK